MTDSTNGTRPGVTIVAVHAKDFQGLEVCEVVRVPGSGLVRVTGKNGAGKTSVLKVIRAGLGGAAEVHERSFRDGDEPEVSIELSNGWHIRRHPTEASPKGVLSIVGPDGGKYGQTQLDGLVGPLSFDLLALFDLPADRVRKILLGLARDPELGEKLDALRAVEAGTKEERRPLISERQRIERVKEPEGERREPVIVSDEMARFRELQGQQRAYQDAGRAVTRAEEGVESAQSAVDSAEAEVLRIEAALLAARADVEAKVELRNAAMGHVSAAEQAMTAMADPSEEIEAVQARLDAADAVNASIKPWESWDADQEKLAGLKEQIADLDERIDGTRTDARALIAAAGIPVPGVSFDPETGELLLHGRPLELACGRERVEMAAAMAFAANPHLRICLLDEGDTLDDDGLDALARESEARGFQVWLASVGRSGPGDVVVEAGRAVSTAGPALVAD